VAVTVYVPLGVPNGTVSVVVNVPLEVATTLSETVYVVPNAVIVTAAPGKKPLPDSVTEPPATTVLGEAVKLAAQVTVPVAVVMVRQPGGGIGQKGGTQTPLTMVSVPLLTVPLTLPLSVTV
jgi:hypothetical protein